MFELRFAAWLLTTTGLGLSLVSVAAAEVLFDPTRPPRQELPAPVTKAEQQELPRLQGVFSRGGRYSALLDGRSVRVGDQIAQYEVVAIHPDRVELSYQGDVMSLRLPSLRKHTGGGR